MPKELSQLTRIARLQEPVNLFSQSLRVVVHSLEEEKGANLHTQSFCQKGNHLRPWKSLASLNCADVLILLSNTARNLMLFKILRVPKFSDALTEKAFEGNHPS